MSLCLINGMKIKHPNLPFHTFWRTVFFGTHPQTNPKIWKVFHWSRFTTVFLKEVDVPSYHISSLIVISEGLWSYKLRLEYSTKQATSASTTPSPTALLIQVTHFCHTLAKKLDLKPPFLTTATNWKCLFITKILCGGIESTNGRCITYEYYSPLWHRTVIALSIKRSPRNETAVGTDGFPWSPSNETQDGETEKTEKIEELHI
jgi:hypothetical protein